MVTLVPSSPLPLTQVAHWMALPSDLIFATPTSPVEEAPSTEPPQPAPAHHNVSSPYVDDATGEPVLTADELRALLHDPPANIPSSTE